MLSMKNNMLSWYFEFLLIHKFIFAIADESENPDERID